MDRNAAHDDLTIDERDQIAACEAVIDAGLRTFVAVGTALATIRDKHLYRQTHETFPAYALDRFGIQSSHAYRLIDAAKVVEALSPIGDKITNEAQARELVPLLDNRKRMRAVVEWADTGGPITAAGLRRARQAGEPHGDSNSAIESGYDIAIREGLGWNWVGDSLWHLLYGLRELTERVRQEAPSAQERRAVSRFMDLIREQCATLDALITEPPEAANGGAR